MASVASPVARSCARPAARAVNARNSGLSIPRGAILFYDANRSESKELARKGHDLNSLVLGDQNEIQPDGSSLTIGAVIPVDTIGGEKWLRSCGAVTNLFSGDASTVALRRYASDGTTVIASLDLDSVMTAVEIPVTGTYDVGVATGNYGSTPLVITVEQ